MNINLKDIKKGMIVIEDTFPERYLALEDARKEICNGSNGYICKMQCLNDNTIIDFFEGNNCGGYGLNLILMP